RFACSNRTCRSRSRPSYNRTTHTVSARVLRSPRPTPPRPERTRCIVTRRGNANRARLGRVKTGWVVRVPASSANVGPAFDAVSNVGRTALVVASLAAGAGDAMRVATEDRLHQDRRLARARDTHIAIDAMLDAGAFAAWLSGSGPSAAAFVDRDDAESIAAA